MRKDNEKPTVPIFADFTSRCCSGSAKFDAIRSCWTSLGKSALLSILEALYRDSGLHHLSKEEVCLVATESLNAHLDSPEDPATRRKKTHIPEEVSRKIQSTLWYQKEMGDTLKR